MERERRFFFYETKEEEEEDVYTYQQDGLTVVGVAKSQEEFNKMVEQIKQISSEEGEGEA